MYAVENPATSRLWKWRPMARCLRNDISTTHDACAYGAAWKKPTTWKGNVPGLEKLSKRCPGNIKHVVLQGT
eukprot:8776197-Karenia_brevis.AAC.1